MKKSKVAGFEIWEYEELVSTNTQAGQLSGESLRDKTVILTWKQTQGRGQAGNHWESEPEKNIAISVILCPERCEAVRQFGLSMVIALGVSDFLARYVKDVKVKWPNDVYVGDRKIAGILIEHRIVGAYIRSSVCGVGVNINQRVFFSDAPNPVSLFQLLGKELDLRVALEELLVCIDKRYGQLDAYGELKADFLDRLYRGKGVYSWEDEDGVFRASIDGIDEYGRLCLKDEKGRERVYGFKEIKYLKSGY